MRAIRVARPGAADVLSYEEVELPPPGPGEVRVRVAAVGVNYIDVYHRSGLYPLPAPFTPGSEAAGRVDGVGPGVDGFAPGDPVAWAMVRGAYAEIVNVPAERLVRVPDPIDLRIAAAVMLQGLTAHYLAVSTHPVATGTTALVHAAAGGVGGLLVQLAKSRGGRVFGTASTAKLDLVRALGADAVIDYTTVDFQVEVLRLTDGAGVHVVYDSVGRSTFEQSLECLRSRGTLVSFGQSSGPVPPFDPLRLSRRSLYLTRPTLAHYIETRAELEWRARELFAAVASGALRVRIDREIALRDAAEAHRLLESRATSGKVLLIP
jgi:NADPH2:quinone reductase